MCSARSLTPINADIKNCDRNRARTIVHINISDQESLTRASIILVAQSLPTIKIQLTTDYSATDLNYCSYSSPFSYQTISNALSLLFLIVLCLMETSNDIFRDTTETLRSVLTQLGKF